ncbi:hypothetical protein F383_12393 [Gossypium arboreum]|uniref:Uncharacterized protein n=1 Tax=Gossypium arboreum TaxID=29729 RepID=A0A0B0Q0E8_GOSAR|nr:hypothetical protein F383_12393 [Gossypium arboreum]
MKLKTAHGHGRGPCGVAAAKVRPRVLDTGVSHARAILTGSTTAISHGLGLKSKGELNPIRGRKKSSNSRRNRSTTSEILLVSDRIRDHRS